VMITTEVPAAVLNIVLVLSTSVASGTAPRWPARGSTITQARKAARTHAERLLEMTGAQGI
jgi:hypothetical protein